jgi:hypothetical protein
MTRPDVYHDKNLIKKILSHKLDELVLYSSVINQGEDYFGPYCMDAAAYGTSATMDIFSSIYKHLYLSGDYNMLMIGHSLIPHYMNYIGLIVGSEGISQELINKVRRPETYKKWVGNIDN